MSNVYKNPQVIRDLIHIASYLAEENMEVGEQFLIASEETLHSIYRILAIFSCGYSDNPYVDLGESNGAERSLYLSDLALLALTLRDKTCDSQMCIKYGFLIT